MKFGSVMVSEACDPVPELGCGNSSVLEEIGVELFALQGHCRRQHLQFGSLICPLLRSLKTSFCASDLITATVLCDEKSI